MAIWMAIVQAAQMVSDRNKQRNAQLGIGAGSGSVNAEKAVQTVDTLLNTDNQQFQGFDQQAAQLKASQGSFMNQTKTPVTPIQGFGLGR